MKAMAIILAGLALFFAKPADAAPKAEPGSDYHILVDKVKDGVRQVIATPSEMVCSRQIDLKIDVKTRKITYCKFTSGCPGNTLAVGKLVVGLTVEEAVKKLRGIPCGNRPTSCPDQLARVLETLKW